MPPESPTTNSRADATSSPTTSPKTVAPHERTGKRGLTETSPPSSLLTSSPIASKVNFPDAGPSDSGFYFHGRRKGSYDLPGRKEPHPTPCQHCDAEQSAYEQVDVSGEEVEARLRQGITPKTLKKGASPHFSDLSLALSPRFRTYLVRYFRHRGRTQTAAEPFNRAAKWLH